MPSRASEMLRSGRHRRQCAAGKEGDADLAARAGGKRIDAIFHLERAIDSLPADQRLATRRAEIAPLVADLHIWMPAERARLSRHAPDAKAMLARFLEDGRIRLTNNAAERSLRDMALGRKAWLFAGSERGRHRAAFMYTLIVAAKMHGADRQAWLADALASNASNASTPISRLDELLPWNWVAAQQSHGVKAA